MLKLGALLNIRLTLSIIGNIVFVQETFQETNSKLEWDLPTDAPHPNLERSDIAHLCGQRNLAERGDGSQRYATAEILAGPNLLAVSITD